MGMHFGMVIARGSVAQLRTAIFKAWPKLQLVEAIDNLPDANALWSWKKSHEQFVSAAKWTKDNPGRDVYGLWQDGPWAVMFLGSWVLAREEELLARMSELLGTVASFVVETAGGSAFFWYFEEGRLLRQISNSDGEMTFKGEPLPQEKGIDVSHYYMKEFDALWRAFGLTAFPPPPAGPLQAICVSDRTDYSKG